MSHKHQSILTRRCCGETQHIPTRHFGESLNEDLGRNVVTLVDNHQAESFEGRNRNFLHGYCLKHRDDYVETFHFTDISLNSSNASVREKAFYAVHPLVSQERVVNNDESRNTKLRGDIQSTDSLASTCVQTQDSIMGSRFQERIDDRFLNGS